MTPKEILEEVKARITEKPGDYNQKSFCGTGCCIAGHIDVVVNGLEKHLSRSDDTVVSWLDSVKAIESEGLKALGLPEGEHIWLFGSIDSGINEDEHADPDYWPSDLAFEYETARSADERAVIGGKAIDRYIEECGL